MPMKMDKNDFSYAVASFATGTVRNKNPALLHVMID